MIYFEPFADGVVGAASNSLNSRRQMALLDQCKTSAECQLQLLCSARDSGGNPKAIEFHGLIDESCDNLREALNEILQTIGETISESGIVSTMVDQISKAIAKVRTTIIFSYFNE